MGKMDLLQVVGELRGLAARIEEMARPGGEAGKVPIYGQRDALWAGERLGHGATTIGEYGCAVTCLAMAVSAETGARITPLEMNRRLVETCGGFVGPNGNLVVWAKVSEAVPELGFDEVIDCQSQPAPVELINEVLAEGGYVLAQVDFQPGGEMDQHWVLLTGRVGEGYWVNDPWDGRRFELPPAYCRVGWDAARAIFRVVVYRGTT